MAYEYEGKLLDYASGSKTYEEFKAMTQELKEVYHKAKAFDEINKNECEGETMNNTLEIKLLSENATMPERHHNTDAGFDIFASETRILEPQEKAKIKTDVAVNIPEGYVGLLTSRSGVSSKTDLVIETGKIDAGYTGHMQINIKNDDETLENWNSYNFHWSPIGIDGEYIERPKTIENKVMEGSYQINKGDKLAQLVIVPIWTPELQKVDEFSNETARGQNGFGSSGTR